MTPAQLKSARASLGLTQTQLATVLQINKRTLAGWELGTRNGKPQQIPTIAALAIEALITKHGK